MHSEYNNPASPSSEIDDLEGLESNRNVNVNKPATQTRSPKKGVSFFGFRQVEETDDNEPEPETKPRKSLNKKQTSASGLGSIFSFRSEISYESGVLSAAEEGDTSGLGTRNTGNRKVQFHQAKKLRRAVSQHYLRHMNDIAAARFENWNKAELIRLLVEDKHYELLDEENIDVVALRDLTESLYANDEMPRKPQPYSIFDIVLRNVMARRIQNAWFAHLENKLIKAEQKRQRMLERRMTNLRSSLQLTGLNEEDIYHLNGHQQIIVGGNTVDIEAGQSTIPLDFFDDLPSANEELEDPVLVEEQPSADLEDQPVVTRDLGLESTPPSPAVKAAPKKRIKNILDIPWTPPDIMKAQKYADYVQPRKGGKGGELYGLYDTHTGRHCCLGSCGEQFDLWREGKVSEFSIYGSGVTNYFKFMKWGFWLFMILAVIALPELVLNNMASTYNSAIQGNRGLKELARTSVGNLAYAFQNGTLSIYIPGCHSEGVYQIGCNLHGRDLSMLYSILDIVICGVILIAFIWLKLFETEEERELNKSTVTVSMYSISVSNLSPDVTETDLIGHFTKLAGYPDSVATVSIAYDNLEEYEECKQRGRIIHEKIRLVHELRYKCTRIRESLDNDHNTSTSAANAPATPIASHVLHSSTGPNGNTTFTSTTSKPPTYTDSIIQRQEKAKLIDFEVNIELEKFYNRMKELNAELSAKDKKLEQLAQQSTTPIYAFVTFNKVADRMKVEKLYHEMSWYDYFFRYKEYSLNGKFLKVRPAPEPSVIIWENLMFSLYERIRRRCFTTFTAFLLVIISVIMIFSSKYLEQRAQNNGSASKASCPTDWDSYSEARQQAYVSANSDSLHCYCDQLNTFEQSTNSYCQHYLQENIQSQVLVYFASFVILVVNTLMEKILRFLSSFEKHHTSDSKEKSMFIRLFVLKYINTAAVFLINNNNVILNKIYGLDSKGSPEFTANWYNSVGVTIILVQLGDLVNGHLDNFIQYVKYRWRRNQALKDHGITEGKTISGGCNSFSSGNTNSGGNAGGTSSLIASNVSQSQVLGGEGSGGGRNENLPRITTSQPAANGVQPPPKRPAGKNVAYTQDLLNKMFVGPEFEFSHNYSQLVTTVFVCLTFSTGIPILYPIAAVNFGIFYYSEKFFFTRMYKIPPHFNSLVGQMATGLMPFALIVHIIMAMWVLSNDGLFGNGRHTSSLSGTDEATYYYGGSNSNYAHSATSVEGFRERLVSKITGYATFPLFIVLLVTAGVIVVMYVTQSVTMGIEKMYFFLFGCCRKKNDVNGRQAQKNTVYDRSYHSAMRRNLIKGLATYNILQNPAYKEAFGITWKFAVDNKDVRSVRLLQLRAEETADEVDAARIEQLKVRAAMKNAPLNDSPGKNSGKKINNMKNIARNRSFYTSFYQPPHEDQIAFESNLPTRTQQAMMAGKKVSPGSPMRTPEPPHKTPEKEKGKEKDVMKDTSKHERDSSKRSSSEKKKAAAEAAARSRPPPEIHNNRALPAIPSREVVLGKPPAPEPPPVTPPPVPYPADRHTPAPEGSSSSRRHRDKERDRDRDRDRGDRDRERDRHREGDGHHRHKHRHRDRGGESERDRDRDRDRERERERERAHRERDRIRETPQQIPPPTTTREYPIELDADGFQKHSFLLYNEPKHSKPSRR